MSDHVNNVPFSSILCPPTGGTTLKYPTKVQKRKLAARRLGVPESLVRTKGHFWNTHERAQAEEAELQPRYITEVTDAWGEMGARGYLVVWYTLPEYQTLMKQ